MNPPESDFSTAGSVALWFYRVGPSCAPLASTHQVPRGDTNCPDLKLLFKPQTERALPSPCEGVGTVPVWTVILQGCGHSAKGSRGLTHPASRTNARRQPSVVLPEGPAPGQGPSEFELRDQGALGPSTPAQQLPAGRRSSPGRPDRRTRTDALRGDPTVPRVGRVHTRLTSFDKWSGAPGHRPAHGGQRPLVAALSNVWLQTILSAQVWSTERRNSRFLFAPRSQVQQSSCSRGAGRSGTCRAAPLPPPQAPHHLPWSGS